MTHHPNWVIGLFFASASVLAAAAPASASVVEGTACITSDPYNIDATSPTLFQPVPVGCDLHNTAPLTVVGVEDTSGTTHDVTISDLVFYNLPGSPDTSVYFSGTYDGVTPFTDVGTAHSVPDDPIFTTSQGLNIAMEGTLPALYFYTSSPDVFLYVEAGAAFNWEVDDIGGGMYSSTLLADLDLQMTGNGGVSFVDVDPPFALETYSPDLYPGLEALIGVPEPATLALFGLGLAGVTASRRRRGAARTGCTGKLPDAPDDRLTGHPSGAPSYL